VNHHVLELLVVPVVLECLAYGATLRCVMLYRFVMFAELLCRLVVLAMLCFLACHATLLQSWPYCCFVVMLQRLLCRLVVFAVLHCLAFNMTLIVY
jgi:hypothetical protein